MATNVITSIGNRAAHNVTVATVTAAVVPGHPNAWTLSISSAIHQDIKPGDKIESGGKSYLILSIAPSSIVVAGDIFSSTVAPATGSVSSSRAFASIQTWVDASPVDLVSADVVWTGHLHKEGTGPNNEWHVTSSITSNNRVCDSTRFIHLTAAPGESAADSINKQDLPVRYEPSNGVAVSFAGNYTDFIYLITRSSIQGGIAGTPENSESRFYVSKLQIKKANKAVERSLCVGSSDGLRRPIFKFDSCIIYNAGSKNTSISEINNCVMYLDGVSVLKQSSFGVGMSSCTVINIGARTHAIHASNYAHANSHFFNNTVLIGFDVILDLTSKIDTSKTFNIATDLPAVGFACPNALTGVVPADCFVSLNPANLDFRLKAGSPLLGKGSLLGNPYNSTMDMLSRARSPTSPSIGAIESVWTPITPTPPAASALPDRHISRGIARGFERGIV